MACAKATAAERVIAEIEDRLEDADDQPRVERELASAIYAIRRTREDVHRWQRHFLGRWIRACCLAPD